MQIVNPENRNDIENAYKYTLCSTHRDISMPSDWMELTFKFNSVLVSKRMLSMESERLKQFSQNRKFKSGAYHSDNNMKRYRGYNDNLKVKKPKQSLVDNVFSIINLVLQETVCKETASFCIGKDR